MNRWSPALMAGLAVLCLGSIAFGQIGEASGQATPTTTESLTVSKLNHVLYVGGGIHQWPGADIGAQINSAYESLPNTGGTIVVVPQTNGSCYNYATPITFTTTGKYIILQGAASSTSDNTDPGEACLNYMPTNESAAITIDSTPSWGGGYAPGGGLRDLTLTNNSCSTHGGCGSSAIGVNIGPTNGGAHAALFMNTKVSGFGRGYNISDEVGWGIKWINSTVVWNTIGISVNAAHENDQFIAGIFSANGTAVRLGAWGAELSIIGGSVDSSVTCGVEMAPGSILHAAQVHWENLSGATTHYICGGATNQVDIQGGIAYDDERAGETDKWFDIGTGTVTGLQISSFGRRAKTVFNIGTRAKIDVQNNNFMATPNLINWPPVANLQVVGPGLPPSISVPVSSFGTVSIGGGTPLQTSEQSGTGSLCMTTNCQLTDPIINGTQIRPGQTLTMPGSLTTSAAALDTVSIPGVTSASHCSLSPSNAEAAANLRTAYIVAKSSGIVTVAHVALPGMTYDLLCTAN